MKTIKSKFDKDTVYKVADKSVTIKTDGEDMKFPIRLIPNMLEIMNFFPEIKAELQEIYDNNPPEEEKPTEIPCAICGKPFPKRGNKKYCSRECHQKALVKQNAVRRRKIAAEKKANGVEKVCAVCGEKFVLYDNFHTKYCSDECLRAAGYGSKKSTFGKEEKKKKKSQIAKIEKDARKKGLRYADIQKQETLAMIGSIKIN